ncbi:putative bifunctional diguanylate cyclase/phosphodiesterase, partial [Cellulomonas citrea]|uniref:putative bifunctional diguanylate cyclase/phosphodiesterase n=1 Tax=Cellulomonas citrea TaxID=1909423 RepID=UPI00135A88DD
MTGPHDVGAVTTARASRRGPLRWSAVPVIAMWIGVSGALGSWVVELTTHKAMPMTQGALASVLALVLPTAVAWWAAAGRGRELLPARLAAVALTLFVAGTVWNGAAILVTGTLPIPSPADVGFVGFYTLLLAALGVLLRAHLVELRIHAGLDLAASVLTVLALLSVPLDPLLHRALDGQMTLGLALAVLYPVLDLLLFTVLIAVVMFGGGRAVPGWGWIGAALVSFVATDVMFAVGRMDQDALTTSMLQLGWFLGITFMAMWTVSLARAGRQGGRPALGRSSAQYSETVATATAASATLGGLAVLVLGTKVELSMATRVLAGLAIVFFGVRAQVAFRQVRRHAALMRIAHTDDLTDLPNRRALYSHAEDRLAPGSADAALLLMDLDRFKEVNDGLGHHMGDRLLVLVSRRLRSCLPTGAMLARLGGDEFAILMTAASPAPALELAAQVRAAMAVPFVLDGMSVEVTVSIGVALFPEHGEDLPSLLRRADIAMYKAKGSAKLVHLYRPGADDAGTERLARVAEVRSALERGEFVPHYQPKLDLGLGRVTGVEALVRWQHPVDGLRPPGSFLELVEDAGLMPRLTRSMLVQALDQVVAWRRGGVDLTVAVNLSASALIDAEVPGQVMALLAERSLDPSVLKLEITEDLLMADRRQARAILTELRDDGVRIAIDDFGSGYSSLAYLRDLPIDELKIDRSFVDPLTSDP